MRFLAATLLLVGSFLSLTASLGLVRFPDTLSRMHAATKPQVVGLILVLLGASVLLRGHRDVWMLVLTGLFTLATAPAIAHLIGRTAYREERRNEGLMLYHEREDDL
ncbi:monovalent cation/H(+) antiporter subunit G [Nocardia stercoris]|uniref:Monovalent cation/H(+) antiporter subunit G n=1 Tax=Nocardia stercoris TaxID=2483361 RepID=A0A3M2LCM1_9NOCA|nr:monovalent cation/H(+) antiporter subunit G [Nocardia stercoris]